MHTAKNRRSAFSFLSFGRFVVTVFCALSLIAPASAWNDTGHMVVATIAARHLDEDLQARLEQLAAPGAQPKNNTFITSACWADDLRDQDAEQYNSLHYINLPWSIDGTPAPPPSATNIVWALERCRSTLRNDQSPELEKARALRFLVHFAGDIHQPLHTISRYSQQWPQGDRGGNAFTISTEPKLNLHWFWDGGGGAFNDKVRRPLTPASRSILTRLADECEAALPFSQFKSEAEPDFRAWAEESHLIARTAVYVGINENEIPSTEYSQRAQLIAKQRAALAGYRLAALLSSIG